MRNFNTFAALTTPQQILGPNPYRYAILVSPIAAQPGSSQPITAVVFGQGAAQIWAVPDGVTQVIDIYGWGCGGDSGASGATLGGGGGGGGGFCTGGPLAVVPGSVFTLDVPAHGGAINTQVTNPSGTQIILAGRGRTAILDAAGVAGVATTGVIKQAGGAGFAATGLASAGGGGGGAGGDNSAGSAGVNSVGGAGGGIDTLLTFGDGGTGGNGSASGIAGLPGESPGAGGGGGGAVTGAVGIGADGQVVFFYALPSAGLAISIDQDPGLIVGQGSMNFLPGITAPYLVTANDIGSAIMDPWYVISGLAGQVVRITEYSYVPEA